MLLCASFNQLTGKMERVAPSATPSGPVRGPAYFGSGGSVASGVLYGEPNISLGVADEYNPLCPNDFEELARIKREKRKAEVSAT